MAQRLDGGSHKNALTTTGSIINQGPSCSTQRSILVFVPSAPPIVSSQYLNTKEDMKAETIQEDTGLLCQLTSVQTFHRMHCDRSHFHLTFFPSILQLRSYLARQSDYFLSHPNTTIFTFTQAFLLIKLLHFSSILAYTLLRLQTNTMDN